jgi:undecaprenyl diphosphate synthase
VAIIMDGNGRWAAARGLSRSSGHREGGKAVRAVVEAAPDHGVGTLTLYAFSADNWSRPAAEVAFLMRLFGRYLQDETPRLIEEGVRLSVIGRRDRLPTALTRRLERAERATREGTALHLRLAVDYSGRDAILEAARRAGSAGAAGFSREAFLRLVSTAHASAAASAPDVDLLIRTGGEKRLSDFLLWESAYAEIYFTERMWPDFGAADLEAALRDFHARERRFGQVGAAT